ncbi:MAG TPA: hypothetical protein PLZ36_01020 [Armatimonadota bacterium]|nr:hypothetical protein [Armatimonadota bacterium]HOS43178.1 hypothetical protein [Armatimonadota bacterium]
MAPLSGIGMLAVIENGEPRFRPLEFVTVDGELWAASRGNLEHCDGQHVEVLFFNEGYDLAQVQGVLRCSHHAGDLDRLRALCQTTPPYPASTHQDEMVIKVIPGDTEVLPAYHQKNGENAG